MIDEIRSTLISTYSHITTTIRPKAGYNLEDAVESNYDGLVSVHRLLFIEFLHKLVGHNTSIYASTRSPMLPV